MGAGSERILATIDHRRGNRGILNVRQAGRLVDEVSRRRPAAQRVLAYAAPRRTDDLDRPGLYEYRQVGTGPRRSLVAARRFPAVAGVRPSGAEAASVVERVTAVRRQRLRDGPRYKGAKRPRAPSAERAGGQAAAPDAGNGGGRFRSARMKYTSSRSITEKMTISGVGCLQYLGIAGLMKNEYTGAASCNAAADARNLAARSRKGGA